MPVYKIPITALPDTGEVALAGRFGDITAHCLTVSEQFLRILSKQPPRSLRAALRFRYHPDRKWQDRTDMELSVFCGEEHKEFVHNLLLSGPLTPLYINGRTGIEPQITALESDPVPDDFQHVSEIIRFEEALVSDERKRETDSFFRNDYIPPTYWAIFPFEPREDNRWMQLDQALAACKHPAMIEILIEPTDILQLRESHYEYITQLMKINAYGSEPDPDDKIDLASISDFNPYKDLRYKDQYADELLRDHETFHETLREPQLAFALRCWSSDKEELRLITPIVGESCFQEGRYTTLFSGSKKSTSILKESSCLLQPEPGLLNEPVWKTIEENDPETTLGEYKQFSHLASVTELLSCFRLPVPNPDSRPLTMHKQTEYPRDKAEKKGRKEKEEKPAVSILVGDDSELTGGVPREYGKNTKEVFGDDTHYPVHRLPLELLKKHMFICGVPGSGKTTAVYNFLVQLHMHNIPFLVLESAKTEYRILKRLKHSKDPVLKSLGESIRVYTPGNETVSPFRFNPMQIPEGITPDEHMNNLLSSFQAAMNMPEDTPLPALLGRALEEVYDTYDPENPPYLADLVQEVREIMDDPELGYDSEIKGNLRTAIEVRLSPLVSTKRSIGKIFSRDQIRFDLEEAMRVPCVIEMDSLSTEQSNLLSLFLLTGMREIIKATRRSGSPLQHMIVLEEAHNVVGNIPESADPADPRKKAADYITRMLAELRALGEGMMIADQLPSAVASSVIKNTGTKLAHRLTSMDDREEIAYTMLLGAVEIEDFARLQPGESFFYAEGMYKPRRVRCINSNEILGFQDDEEYPPDNGELFELLEDEEWFYEVLQREIRIDLHSFDSHLEQIDYLLSVIEKTMKKKKQPSKQEIWSSYQSIRDVMSALDENKDYILSMTKKGSEGIYQDDILSDIREFAGRHIELEKKTNTLFKKLMPIIKNHKE